MSRLTKRISGYAHGAEGISEEKLSGNYCRGEFEATACVEKLCAYEDAEEQGRLIVLPVSEATIVWCVVSCGEMCELWGVNCKGCIPHAMVASRLFDRNMVAFWDTTVFRTREEAEAALKKMKVENNE